MGPGSQALAWSVLGHVLCLVALLDAQSCLPPDNVFTNKPTHAFYRSGESTASDVNIAGIFSVHGKGETPYHCGELRRSGVQYMEAFLWSVRTFKARYPMVLSDANIGAIGFDSCGDTSRITQQILNFENCDIPYGRNPPVIPSSVLAYVGTDSSTTAASATTLLQGMNKTLVSHAATGAFLSDSKKYPYFLRTVPSNAAQATTISSVLGALNWNYTQVVVGNNDYGKDAYEAFVKAAKLQGICIVGTHVIGSSQSNRMYDKIVEDLSTKQKTRVVVVLADADDIRGLLQATARVAARGRFTWIGTSTWENHVNLLRGVETVTEGAVAVLFDSNVKQFENVVLFRDYYTSLKPSSAEYNPWLKPYWEDRFACHLTNRTARYSAKCNVNVQTFSPLELDDFVPYVIQAVDAVLHGIEEARDNSCPNTNTVCARFVNKETKLLELRKAIKQPNTTRQTINNYRPPHDNYKNHDYVQVGTYDSHVGAALAVGEVHMYDSTGNRVNPPIPSLCASKPCTECGERAVSTEKPTAKSVEQTEKKPPNKIRDGTWVIVLIILTGLGVVFIIILEIYLMSQMVGSPFVNHWRTMWLGQLLLFSLLLCYLVLFAFVPSPTMASCAIKRFCVGVSYSMCFAVLLVKLMIILSSKSIGYLKGVYQFLMFVFAWGVQIVVDVEWLILREPGVYLSNNTDGGDQWVCNEDFPSHLQSLVYVMFLIVVCTILAVKAHDIITNHRECVFIGMAAGFTIPVWLAWVLVGMLHSNEDFQEPAMAFGLFATTTIVLFVMFVPKVRQLNSMGMEGIYAEDDVPDYGGSGMLSIGPASRVPGSLAPASVVYGPASTKSKMGPASLAYHNGSAYAEPMAYTLPTTAANPEALYLRHPGSTMNPGVATSVRSVPVGYVTRQAAEPKYATTSRVLRRTNDLSGKPVPEKTTQSEYNYNVCYGTTKSDRSRRASGSLRSGARSQLTLTKARSLQDLGSL